MEGTVKSGRKPSSELTTGKWKRAVAPYLFVLPNLLIFTVFIVVPAIFGLMYSFAKYDGLNPMKFIGLRNYTKVFTTPDFWNAFGKSVEYVVISVPLIYVCSLAIALILSRELAGKGFFRSVFYWPTLISYIIVGLTWKWIFSDSFGIMNYLLGLAGIDPVQWLTDPFHAKMTIIVATVWSRLGFYMVIFIAGLQAIPQDYYEAATLDGASKARSFWSITLPLLKPTSVLVAMLSVIEAFKAYPLMKALTGGGPGKETTYVVQYIYQIGFDKQDLGLASAMSVVLLVIIAGLSVLQLKLTKGGES
ncbi:carbohydrate ABC transporter permease [Paenibacillus aestuarii]|uniref:Sugar ABC transporter permease n=1 Tax=Paenibacillus aestuarii TaxID=516965 RepID=A0ABW0KB34_9BACL|nr:sugar ABC transporter permease [Paenibacillus aestuarii]